MGTTFSLTSSATSDFSEQMVLRVRCKDLSIKQIVELENVNLGTNNTFQFNVSKLQMEFFTTLIGSYLADCGNATSYLYLPLGDPISGFGCSPVFQWSSQVLTENQIVYLKFGSFTITYAVQNISGVVQINSLKPRHISPESTAKPNSMLINIGDIMAKYKKADVCDNFLLSVQVGSI